jgi:hypothetical protein
MNGLPLSGHSITANPATAPPRSRARIRIDVRRHRTVIMLAAAIAVVVAVSVAALGVSLAVFTAQEEQDAVFGSKTVFPGERVTPAFQIGDASSGAEVDRSSTFGFAADGLTTTTKAWSTAFAGDRYLEFDLNDSLASGVAVSSPTFDFRFSSSGAGQACFYFEVRRISTGAVLGTYGSSGSPVGCVTGTSLTAVSTGIPALATTSIANDLRIRLFAKESAGAEMVIDQATVGGTTAYQSFTLYPVMFRDAADTIPESIPWGLAVP